VNNHSGHELGDFAAEHSWTFRLMPAIRLCLVASCAPLAIVLLIMTFSQDVLDSAAKFAVAPVFPLAVAIAVYFLKRVPYRVRVSGTTLCCTTFLGSKSIELPARNVRISLEPSGFHSIEVPCTKGITMLLCEKLYRNCNSGDIAWAIAEAQQCVVGAAALAHGEDAVISDYTASHDSEASASESGDLHMARASPR